MHDIACFGDQSANAEKSWHLSFGYFCQKVVSHAVTICDTSLGGNVNLLHAFSPACNGFLRFTSGAIPADILMANIAAEPIWWTQLHMCTSIGGSLICPLSSCVLFSRDGAPQRKKRSWSQTDLLTETLSTLHQKLRSYETSPQKSWLLLLVATWIKLNLRFVLQ